MNDADNLDLDQIKAKYPNVRSLIGTAKLPRPMSWDEMMEIAREDHVRDLFIRKFGEEEYNRRMQARLSQEASEE